MLDAHVTRHMIARVAGHSGGASVGKRDDRKYEVAVAGLTTSPVMRSPNQSPPATARMGPQAQRG